MSAKEGIDKVEEKLKQGYYSTDDKAGIIRLYDDNLFSFSNIYMSFLPTGTYSINNGKLVLKFSESDESDELVFEIGSGQLILIGANIEGVFIEEGPEIEHHPYKVGTVFKFSENDNLGIVEIETDDMIELHTWYFTSGVQNNAIKVKYSDEKAIFECMVDNGLNSTQYITLKPGDTMHWFDNSGRPVEEAFVNIILKIDDKIIGYAVIKITQNRHILDHTATVLKSVFFPKIDGEYQHITNEQITQRIEQIKIQNLDSYKTVGKTAIEAYAKERKDNYCEDKWTVVCGIVEAGKAAVDIADSKTGVDTAVATAKAEINEVSEAELEQGYYTTDGEAHSIRLYGENQFSFHISYISRLPMGTYRIENCKLVLKFSESDELIFEINNDKLVFTGTNKNGVFVEEGLVKAGTVFKKSFVEVETESMVDCSQFAYSIGMSWIGNPIILKHSENAVFECVVNNGSFSHQSETKNIIIKAGEGFHWCGNETDKDERTFVEIVLKIEDSFIGYAVVEIYKYNESTFYKAKLLKAALLPKVNNEYQQVSQEQIKIAIEQAKKA